MEKNIGNTSAVPLTFVVSDRTVGAKKENQYIHQNLLMTITQKRLIYNDKISLSKSVHAIGLCFTPNGHTRCQSAVMWQAGTCNITTIM